MVTEIKQRGQHVQAQGVSRLLMGSVTILAALSLAGVVALIVLLSSNTAAVKEQTYQQCVEAAGLQETSDIDEMVAIGQRCYSNVYGEETTP